jgi:hypothetical protein
VESEKKKHILSTADPRRRETPDFDSDYEFPDCEFRFSTSKEHFDTDFSFPLFHTDFLTELTESKK